MKNVKLNVYGKKISAVALAFVLMFTVVGAVPTRAEAFTKTKYGMTMKGDSEIAQKYGSAWGSISPKSYISIASVYKYWDRNAKKSKTAPTDLTGAGNSTGASWYYKLPDGGKSTSIKTTWTGIYNGHTLTESYTVSY